MTLAVAFTVSAWRQAYLRKTLDSWCQVRGVRDVLLLFCCEPDRSFPVAEFRDYLQRCGLTYQIRVNESRLGCLANTRRALQTAFAMGIDFAVLAEEDVVVAADALEYFAWSAGHYAEDPEVALACAHAYRSAPGAPAHAVARVAWFSPIVWGTWRESWERFVAPGWGGTPENPDAWDLCLRRRVQAAGLASVFPARSRSLHIGELSTLTPGALAEYFYGASLSHCFSPDYPPQDYAEIPRPPDLAMVV